MNRARCVRGAAMVGALLLAACSSDKATGPGGSSQEGGPYEGTWAVSWGTITGDHASCRLPSMNIVLHQFGDSVVGTYTSRGDLACLRGGLLYSATPGSGQTGGHVSGDSVQFSFSLPLFTTQANAHDTTLSGTLRWLVAFTSIQTSYSVLTGPWSARRLPLPSGPSAPADIELYPNLPALVGGDSGQLADTVRNADGQVLLSAAVTLSTSDAATATVGPTGVLTAKGGTLRLFSIIARSGGAYVDEVGINIPGAARIVVSPATLAMSRFHVARLSVQILDSVGNFIDYVTPTYDLQPTGIVTVTESGEVTASATLGAANVIVHAGNATTSVPVRVVSIPTGFVVTPDSGGLIAPHDSLQMTAKLVDSVGLPVPGSAVTFTSTNPAVLSVSATGLIRSNGPDGYTDITASSGSFSATRRFAVRSGPVPSIVATDQIGGSPFGAAIGPTGAFYVGDGSDGGLYRGDLPSLTFSSHLSRAGSMKTIVFDSSGRRAFVALYQSNYVGVVDVDSNRFVDSIDVSLAVGHANGVWSVGLSPAAPKLFVGSDHGIAVYDPRSLQLDTVLSGYSVSAFSFHPDLPLAYATVSGGVEEIDVDRLQVLRSWSVPNPEGTAVSPDGSELYVAVADSGMRVINLASGQDEGLVSLPGLYDLKILPGADVIVADGIAGDIFVLDRASRVLVERLHVGGYPRRMAVDPTGQVIIEANESGWVDFIK